MKQLFLTICMIMSIGVLIAPRWETHNISLGMTALAESSISPGINKQPFGDFELSKINSTSAHNCRQQYPDVLTDNRSSRNISADHFKNHVNENASVTILRSYLFHIYPSHNFW